MLFEITGVDPLNEAVILKLHAASELEAKLMAEEAGLRLVMVRKGTAEPDPPESPLGQP